MQAGAKDNKFKTTRYAQRLHLLLLALLSSRLLCAVGVLGLTAHVHRLVLGVLDFLRLLFVLVLGHAVALLLALVGTVRGRGVSRAAQGNGKYEDNRIGYGEMHSCVHSILEHPGLQSDDAHDSEWRDPEQCMSCREHRDTMSEIDAEECYQHAAVCRQ